MNSWLISGFKNNLKEKEGYLSFPDENNVFTLFCSQSQSLNKLSNGGWYIQNGYWQLRDTLVNQYAELTNEQLIEYLLTNFSSDYPKMLKGIFTLVIYFNGRFQVLNDNLGLSSIYSTNEGDFFLSNSINCLKDFGCIKNLNFKSYLSRKRFGRDLGGITPFEKISRNVWGEHWDLDFSVKKKLYFHPMSLFNDKQEVAVHEFESLLRRNLCEYEKRAGIIQHAVTLTGGKDARTALALLCAHQKDVVGLTYGRPESKDVIFAKKLSSFEGIAHLVLDGSNWDTQDLLMIWDEIYSLDSPFISHHRAIRYVALKELHSLHGSCAIWSGYMGGEWLMGIYRDNLVFKDGLMDWVEKGEESQTVGEKGIFNSAEVNECFSFPNEWFKNKKRREFAVMCEIGIKHHQQDIEIAMQLGLSPQPFMLDVDWIEMIFKSKFSFVHQDNQSKNLFKRWSLYELNVKLQAALRPEWNNMVFGKKGNYTPNDFLRGRVIWSIMKGLNYLTDRNRYPPSFSYGYAWHTATLQVIEEMTEDSRFTFFDESEKESFKEEFSKLDWSRYSQERSYHPISQALSLYLLFKRYISESNE